LDERKPQTATPWRRADRGADSIVLGSWVALLGLTLLVLEAPHWTAQDRREPVPIETAAQAQTPINLVHRPDFYPWVRPIEPGAAPQVIEPWQPQAKRRGGGFLTRLNAPLDDQIFNASNHSNADSPFYGADWQADNIAARKGAFLEVRREESSGLPYTGAEMQSSNKYGYGRYETIMQPARGSGVVSAFFTYTGPWFGDPHDEIDIEFLGSDTTKVHFNYFKNGKVIKPATFDLPFDAADRPHLYAFDWRPDGITWYVDGVPMYATETGDTGVPTHPSKIMFSAWTGKKHMEGWHGPRTFRDGAGAQFNCVSFTPLGHEGPKCSDTYQTGATYSGAAASGLR
jgi:endo-1,3-1,4-beta-glycanase ExoK